MVKWEPLNIKVQPIKYEQIIHPANDNRELLPGGHVDGGVEWGHLPALQTAHLVQPDKDASQRGFLHSRAVEFTHQRSEIVYIWLAE